MESSTSNESIESSKNKGGMGTEQSDDFSLQLNSDVDPIATGTPSDTSSPKSNQNVETVSKELSSNNSASGNNQSSQDFNNASRVESADKTTVEHKLELLRDSPDYQAFAGNKSRSDWSGTFVVTGNFTSPLISGSNHERTVIKTSDAAEAAIINGKNTTFYIQDVIDGGGRGNREYFYGLTVDTGTGNHYGTNLLNNLNDSKDGDYSYAAWGEWSGSANSTSIYNGATRNSTLTHGYWQAGNETSSVDMPRTGSASYSGSAIGDLQNGNFIVPGGVTGTIGLNMNFAQQNFTGNMALVNSSNQPWANPQIAGTVNTAGASFTATSMTGVTTGGLHGKFFGPGAQEVGGAWKITPDNSGERASSASGVFRAK